MSLSSSARALACIALALGLAACDSATPTLDTDATSVAPGSDAPQADAGYVGGGRDLYDVDVLTRFPAVPGFPEGIAVRGDRVYVSSNTGGLTALPPQLGTPSSIFAFDLATGEQVREYVIEGQNLAALAGPAYGTIGIAFDGSGDLFVLDKAPARVLRINVETGEQTTYATFDDVPLCLLPTSDECSDTPVDLPPFINFPAFAPDGTLYVSDFQQGLVWRVPVGGGEARVAFTDLAIAGPAGPDGLQFRADGTTLVLAQSVNPPGVGLPGAGRLYTLQRQPDGSLSDLTLLFDGAPGDAPDGFAIGQSGALYVASFVNNQVLVLNADGSVRDRIGVVVAGTNGTEIPFDSPANVAFDGQRILVTNHAVTTRNPLSFAVLDIFVAEAGLPLFMPTVGGTSMEDGPPRLP